MSGNFSVQSVQSGVVSNPQSAIIAPSVTTYVKRLTFFNSDPSIQVISVYLVPSGGSASIDHTFTLNQNESCDYLEGAESITLGPGDQIQAISTTNGVVQWNLTGVTET